MIFSTRRTRASFAAVTVAATATAMTIVPASAAVSPQQSSTVTVTHDCRVVGPPAAEKVSQTTVDPDEVSISAPRYANPGDEFTITVQPGQMSSTRTVFGMSYTLKVNGADIVSAVAAGGSEKVNGAAHTELLLGNRARLQGDSVASLTKEFVGDPEGLWASPGSFRLPAMTLTLKANKPGDVTVTFADGKITGTNGLSIGEIQEGGLFGHANDLIYCTAPQEPPLALVTIKDGELPVVAVATNTTVSGPEKVTDPSQPVTFTVTVTDDNGAPVTGGEVNIFVDDSDFGTATVNDQGVATMTAPLSDVETTDEEQELPVEAVYLGTPAFKRSSGETTLTVAASSSTPAPNPDPQPNPDVVDRATTVAVTATEIPPVAGAATVSYTVTATVSADGASYPNGGKVIFTDGDQELGSGFVNNGKATATVQLPAGSGAHTVTASAPEITIGNDHFFAAEASTTVTVPATDTDAPGDGDGDGGTPSGGAVTVKTPTATLSTSATVQSGTATTLTMNYADGAAGANVTFYVDGTKVGESSVNDGVATVSYTFPQAGQYTVTAVASAVRDGNTLVESVTTEPVTVSVTVAPTTDTSVALSGEATGNGSATLTATVSPTPLPQGTYVSFYDGETLIGDIAVDPKTGVATLTAEALSGGEHSFTATYNGDSQTGSSTTTAPLSLTISSSTNSHDTPTPAGPPVTTEGTVEAPEKKKVPGGEGNNGGSSMGALSGKSGKDGAAGSSPLPLIIIAAIVIGLGGVFTIPDVRRQFDLPPLPPLFPVPKV